MGIMGLRVREGTKTSRNDENKGRKLKGQDAKIFGGELNRMNAGLKMSSIEGQSWFDGSEVE